jgi:peptidoglycan/LPS O-acetylase OafA/YrhL
MNTEDSNSPMEKADIENTGTIAWLRSYAFGSQRQIPSLDGIRAISVGFVILAHFCGTPNFPLSKESPVIYLGTFGVRIFFIISGYLITSILISEYKRSGGINLAKFYFRRTLRLFPASWAFITIAAILGSFGLLELSKYDLLFAYTYTSNYYVGRSFAIGHLWSLATEEQFYLLWPLTLLMLRPERAKRFLYALLCISPVCRLLSFAFPRAMAFLSGADTLATGCLLFMLQKELKENQRYQALLASPRLVAVLPFIAAACNYIPSLKLRWAVGDSLQNFCIAVCIDWAMRNPQRGIGRFLNMPVVAMMGVLSYSTYLWQQLFSEYGFTGWVARFPQNLAFTFVAALSSYLLIEGPFLRLREHLEHRRLHAQMEPATR